MAERLLEREAELDTLDAALAAARGGAGAVVLLSGEAGIGKTSVLRAFLGRVQGRVRVLAGVCDDLLTPRMFGPLQDAVRDTGGPLAAGLAGGNRDAVFAALLDEVSGPGQPTVLAVEDAHWADEATLDVLRFLGRRISDLPTVLVVTYRDDEVDSAHPLLRVLGALGGASVHRISLAPLSRAAVANLAGGTPITSSALYGLTAGNPFFVTEVLAAPQEEVPATVVDAVLARVRELDPTAQQALEQLSIVPSHADLGLARRLLGDLAPLAAAERSGVLEVRRDAVAFRHELARRAVEGSLPRSVRMALNAHVLALLREQDPADLPRVVHHAVQAGEDAVVLEHAPVAARQAFAVAAHHQGAALLEQAVLRRHLLPLAEQAGLLEAYAWALFSLHRTQDAVRFAADAVRLREEVGEPGAWGEALVTLGVQQWTTMQPAEALENVRWGVALMESAGETPRLVLGRTYLGGLLVLWDREAEALASLDAGIAAAERLGAADLVGLGAMFRGRARLLLGDAGGLDELLDAIAVARDIGRHELVMRAYITIVLVLWRLGRFDETVAYIDEGHAYARDRDFTTHTLVLDAHRLRLAILRGQWDAAESGLRELRQRLDDPGTLERESLPVLARLVVRRGGADADELTERAWAQARRADTLEWLLPAGLALIEHARWTGRPKLAIEPAAVLRERTRQRGRERDRGELLRYLARLGEPVRDFPGCPPEFALGLRGDSSAAAAAWERIGDPYQHALELLECPGPAPVLAALAVFDELGAAPAAATARRRLRELGVRQIPRGPQPATRANPAGLTDRQAEILRLLACGLTNAEIAARLVLSVRTVDHHVSAVLQKLGVSTRREATTAAAGLGITR